MQAQGSAELTACVVSTDYSSHSVLTKVLDKCAVSVVSLRSHTA